jgi:uncharacterized membrane protein YagU involved in acid resistance
VITSPAEISVARPRALRTIAWAGSIAGILDISSAFVVWGRRGIGPIRGLQIIATGILGPASYRGGLASAGLGLAAHFLIAFTAAALFYAASRKLHFLTQHAVVAGLTYGVAIYIFMNCVILPLAAFKPKYTVSSVATGALILMFLVGLPIALIVKKLSPPQTEPKRLS